MQVVLGLYHHPRLRILVDLYKTSVLRSTTLKVHTYFQVTRLRQTEIGGDRCQGIPQGLRRILRTAACLSTYATSASLLGEIYRVLY